MSLRNTATSYGTITKIFHWTIFTLLLFMIIYGFLLDAIPDESKGMAFNIHKLTGLLLLVLMVARGLWALMNPKPLLPLDTPFIQRIAERLVHYLLYFLIIAMPLAGWIGSSAAGRPPHLGSLNLTFPVPASQDLSNLAFSIHNTVAFLIIIVVGIHISAAFYHHFIKRDNILLRMLPEK